LKKFDAGLHLKTAGTTWLEEVIGLSEAGGDGLALAKEIYADALDHIDDLCAPYATVIDIDRKKLPAKETVNAGLPNNLFLRSGTIRKIGFQSELPATAPRRIQNRREEGRPLPQRPQAARGRHRQKRH